MDKLSDTYGDRIEVIIANNDDMALGAIDAYLARDLQEELPIIVGIDGTEAGLMGIKNGLLYATAYNDSIGQGTSLLELAYRLAVKETLTEEFSILEGNYIRYSSREVIKENVAEYLERKKN